MRRVSLLILLAAAFAAPAFSQQVTVRRATLEYADDVYDLSAVDGRGRDLGEVFIGQQFSEEDSIRTGPSSGAELRLEPNGTIIRIDAGTTFRFDNFQRRNRGTTQVTVYSGKARVVAARVRGANYLVRTPTTALGVRGTDFIVEVRVGQREAVIVREGSVEVFSKRDRRSVIVDAGEWVDALDEEFNELEWDEWDDEFDQFDDFEEFFEEIDFRDLDEEDVFADELYEGDFDYFEEWDDADYEDDFFDDYEWDDEYIDEEFFDEADWFDDEFDNEDEDNYEDDGYEDESEFEDYDEDDGEDEDF